MPLTRIQNSGEIDPATTFPVLGSTKKGDVGPVPNPFGRLIHADGRAIPIERSLPISSAILDGNAYCGQYAKCGDDPFRCTWLHGGYQEKHKQRRHVGKVAWTKANPAHQSWKLEIRTQCAKSVPTRKGRIRKSR